MVMESYGDIEAFLKQYKDDECYFQFLELSTLGILVLCEMLHGDNTGSYQLSPSSYREFIVNYLNHRLKVWTVSCLDATIDYDQAVKELVRATLRESKL